MKIYFLQPFFIINSLSSYTKKLSKSYLILIIDNLQNE